MHRSWPDRFRVAFRGLFLALAIEPSFRVHLPAAIAVAGLAAWLRVSVLEGCVLGLCITLVFAVELVNTGLEHLARAMTRDENSLIRNALDISSAAVLLASLGSAVIGFAILLPKLISIVRM